MKFQSRYGEAVSAPTSVAPLELDQLRVGVADSAGPTPPAKAGRLSFTYQIGGHDETSELDAMELGGEA
jgi:hypothetical protein